MVSRHIQTGHSPCRCSIAQSLVRDTHIRSIIALQRNRHWGLCWNGAWGLSRLRLRFQDVGSVVLDFKGFRIQNHGIMKCNTQVKQLNTMCSRKDTTSSPLLTYVHTDCRDMFRMASPQCARLCTRKGMTSHRAVRLKTHPQFDYDYDCCH